MKIKIGSLDYPGYPYNKCPSETATKKMFSDLHITTWSKKV